MTFNTTNPSASALIAANRLLAYIQSMPRSLTAFLQHPPVRTDYAKIGLYSAAQFDEAEAILVAQKKLRVAPVPHSTGVSWNLLYLVAPPAADLEGEPPIPDQSVTEEGETTEATTTAVKTGTPVPAAVHPAANTPAAPAPVRTAAQAAALAQEEALLNAARVHAMHPQQAAAPVTSAAPPTATPAATPAEPVAAKAE